MPETSGSTAIAGEDQALAVLQAMKATWTKYDDAIVIHGVLACVAWQFLAPMSIIGVMFGRKHHHKAWTRVHWMTMLFVVIPLTGISLFFAYGASKAGLHRTLDRHKSLGYFIIFNLLIQVMMGFLSHRRQYLARNAGEVTTRKTIDWLHACWGAVLFGVSGLAVETGIQDWTTKTLPIWGQVVRWTISLFPLTVMLLCWLLIRQRKPANPVNAQANKKAWDGSSDFRNEEESTGFLDPTWQGPSAVHNEIPHSQLYDPPSDYTRADPSYAPTLSRTATVELPLPNYPPSLRAAPTIMSYTSSSGSSSITAPSCTTNLSHTTSTTSFSTATTSKRSATWRQSLRSLRLDRFPTLLGKTYYVDPDFVPPEAIPFDIQKERERRMSESTRNGSLFSGGSSETGTTGHGNEEKMEELYDPPIQRKSTLGSEMGSLKRKTTVVMPEVKEEDEMVMTPQQQLNDVADASEACEKENVEDKVGVNLIEEGKEATQSQVNELTTVNTATNSTDAAEKVGMDTVAADAAMRENTEEGHKDSQAEGKAQIADKKDSPA